MYSFERFLLKNSLKFIWRSYALTGNIVNERNIPVDEHVVKNMINKFFKECTLDLKLVRSAKNSLIKIAKYYQVLILSNIPFEFYDIRLKALEKSGLDFPFYANQGGKGKVCSYLFENSKYPVWFIDDSPGQINSVKNENYKINTILYIENSKLAKLVKQKKTCDHFSTSWTTNEKILLN